MPIICKIIRQAPKEKKLRKCANVQTVAAAPPKRIVQRNKHAAPVPRAGATKNVMQPLFLFLFTRCQKVKGSNVILRLRAKLLQVQVTAKAATSTSTRLRLSRWQVGAKKEGRRSKLRYFKKKYSIFFSPFNFDFPYVIRLSEESQKEIASLIPKYRASTLC